jgi:hypothetical protein
MDVADKEKRMGPSEFLLPRGGSGSAGGGRRVPAKEKMARLSQQDVMAWRFGRHYPIRLSAPGAQH